MEAYCVKCKAKQEMLDSVAMKIENKGSKSRQAVKGKCPTCGTTMFRIVSSK